VRDVRDRRLIIAPDLKETLVEVDQFEIDTLKMVDEYIVRVGLPAPPEMVPQLRDGYEQEVITELNLEGAGISTIVWAIGNSFDSGFVKLPVVDGMATPVRSAESPNTKACTSWECRGFTADVRDSVWGWRRRGLLSGTHCEPQRRR
jgi:hypothetical protein